VIKSTVKRLRGGIRPLLLKLAGEDAAEVSKLRQWGSPSFEGDAMRTYYKDMSWMTDPRFQEAYQTGFNSGHKFSKVISELRLEWRLHIILWAAQQALHHEGDFVECGVNTGIFSLAICQYLNFSALPRKFYLFDTYEGIPESQMSSTEREKRNKENAAFYEDCWAIAQRNFAPWPNAQLVKGLVPDSLATVPVEKVAYLSIDMNIAKPERDALEYFWPRLSSGGVVILDDYGWENYREQKSTLDEFAKAQNVTICCLPTGQGLLVKP